MFSKHLRTLTAALCLAGFVFAPIPANAQKPTIRRDLSKEFKDLTPSEQIAIRAAAKAAYKDKKLDKLVVCADPGNMPYSDIKLEGVENKIAQVLGDTMGAQVSFYWRPFLERALNRETFDARMSEK